MALTAAGPIAKLAYTIVTTCSSNWKLHVRAEELYPEDYDFSIIFDSVEQRKMRHDMGRKFVEGTLDYNEED